MHYFRALITTALLAMVVVGSAAAERHALPAKHASNRHFFVKHKSARHKAHKAGFHMVPRHRSN